MAVTETWLNDDIEDNLVSISGYNIFRRDRPYRRGGGVRVYLSEHIHTKRRTDFESDNFECLWLCLRPTRHVDSIEIIGRSRAARGLDTTNNKMNCACPECPL